MSGADRLEVRARLSLDGFRLEVEAQCEEFPLLILGPSGSGKTTLLEIIAGLRPQAAAELTWRGRTWNNLRGGLRVPSRERGVGYVTQAYSLFPHMTVRDNVEYGPRWGGRLAGGTLAGPDELLRELGVDHLSGRRAGALSGGEAQRVALARALAAGPSLLLLDEPFAHLDPPTRTQAQSTLDAVLARHPVPTVQVSHDRQELKRFARWLWVLMGGRVVQQGSLAEVLGSPASDDIAVFLGDYAGANG
jgi:ABC-type sulfate/molybdate transport systems ATPase subunit